MRHTRKGADNTIYSPGGANNSFEELRGKAATGRMAIINSGALSVDSEGNLQPGWCKVLNADENDSVGGEGAVTGGALNVMTGTGAPAVAWIAAGALGLAATGSAISGLSAPTASFALTGIGSLAVQPDLKLEFLKSKKKEDERLRALEENTNTLAKSEEEMARNQQQLEAILPEVLPAMRELDRTTQAAKESDLARQTSIKQMCSALSAECNRIDELMDAIRESIEKTGGTMEENAAIKLQTQELASATTNLYSGALEQEGIVNQATDDTVKNVATLLESISNADSTIGKAFVGLQG